MRTPATGGGRGRPARGLAHRFALAPTRDRHPAQADTPPHARGRRTERRRGSRAQARTVDHSAPPPVDNPAAAWSAPRQHAARDHVHRARLGSSPATTSSRRSVTPSTHHPQPSPRSQRTGATTRPRTPFPARGPSRTRRGSNSVQRSAANPRDMVRAVSRTNAGRWPAARSASASDMASATSHADVHQGENACLDEAASTRTEPPTTLGLDEQEQRRSKRLLRNEWSTLRTTRD
jgi:hypothetical protein